MMTNCHFSGVLLEILPKIKEKSLKCHDMTLKGYIFDDVLQYGFKNMD